MMKVPLWKKTGKYLQDFLFPRHCAVCDKRLQSEEEALCHTCLRQLPRTNYHLKEGNRCEQIFYGFGSSLQRATSYFLYERENSYKNLLWKIKYHNQPDLGRIMGRIMAADLQRPPSYFKDIDLLIPVPLSKEKQRKRGYNQCDFIATGISEITNIPIGRKYLIRTIDNASQTHKGREERMANVEQIFRAENTEELIGKHVLLIDDVLTTGATLLACGTALSNIDNIRLSFLTLACTRL